MTAYNAEVDLDGRTLTEHDQRTLSTHLADTDPHGVVDVNPAGAGGALQFTIEAPTLRAAIDTALKTATAAGRAVGGLAPSGVTVITQAEFERRMLRPDLPDLVGVSEAAAVLGVSRQRAGQLIGDGVLGEPVARLASGPLFARKLVESVARVRQTRSGPRGHVGAAG